MVYIRNGPDERGRIDFSFFRSNVKGKVCGRLDLFLHLASLDIEKERIVHISENVPLFSLHISDDVIVRSRSYRLMEGKA